MQSKARHILLDASHAGAVRFLSGLHVNLEEGKQQSWVTVTRTGKFTDPRYGEFEISRSMLLAMVDNFNKGVFGQDVFVDVAHRPNDGAAAKVLKLSVEGDRLRALLEWTPFGMDAVKNKGYRYLSIEYHEQWKDNEQGINHGPVMLGAGLVVRPAIKRLDPIQLSEVTDDGIPVLIHPELQSILLQEMQMKFAELLKKLRSSLEGKKLAEGIIVALMKHAEEAVQLASDEAAAKLICDQFDTTGKQLSEQFGDREVTLSITMPQVSAGLSADQVRQLMADEAKKQADAAKVLAENRTANVKLLSDTIGAATGIDDATKKALADAVTDLITPDMTADQVKKLAEVQIKNGNELVVARQLAALGYPAAVGNVHIPGITVPFEEPKKLGEMYREQMKKTGVFAEGKLHLSAKDNAFVNKVLAEFDRLHAGQIANEVKMLSGGAVNISDTNLPVGFRREVIREALSDLRVLELVQTLTDFTATVTTQIPYELRDMSQVMNDGIVYEGQPIHRAGIGQFMDTAYILPMKLAMLISNEVRHFTQAAAINWDAMARNIESNARIMRELICRRIINELQRAADSYGAVAVANEAFDSQVTGTNSLIKTATFPIVRPYQQRDLQGNAIGNPVNPITITLNGTQITPFDGTGSQPNGTYYRVLSYNLGYIQLVNQAGTPVTPADTGTNTISYSKATNVAKVDLDVAAGLTYEQQLNKVLQAVGARKAVLSGQRFVNPDFLLMSPVLNDTITNAEQFALQAKRNGTDTTPDGDLERVKGLPTYGTNAPGVDLGDERILIGQRGLLGYVVSKPFVTGQPFEAVDSQGRAIGKQQAYGEEYSAIKVPTPVANRMTSVLAYSFSGR
ncbi:Mu-like prophage I protein [Paucimonas lemoignei]|uniref:Mu-like prophage I protein n=1 Tax=Paucimonas lemoignei TaxID=29443 RepID=A0A4V2UIE1_PAULE|nr:phage protease [Paucimonas lemoignei]TCS35790.1 Mu-like prophage I protein [Paucimonas lemoignei]